MCGVTPPNGNAPASNRGETDTTTQDHTVHRIGASVDAVIEATLWRLLNSEIEFKDVTPGLTAWFMAGANLHGDICCQATIDRLRAERDMWFACYSNRWTPGEYMRRRTDALWEVAA